MQICRDINELLATKLNEQAPQMLRKPTKYINDLFSKQEHDIVKFKLNMQNMAALCLQSISVFIV